MFPGTPRRTSDHAVGLQPNPATTRSTFEGHWVGFFTSTTMNAWPRGVTGCNMRNRLTLLRSRPESRLIRMLLVQLLDRTVTLMTLGEGACQATSGFDPRTTNHILLFARLNADERAFVFLGPATYVSHVGELPMAITWRLKHALPGDLFQQFAAAVA